MDIKVSVTLDVDNVDDNISVGEITRGVEYVLQRAHLSKRIAEQLDGIVPFSDVGVFLRLNQKGGDDG